MAAFLASVVSLILSRALGTSAPVIRFVPRPPVHHVVLPKEFIERFQEVVVIGDVHGCYDELMSLLDILKEGSDGKILKVFVGDLVNKGPKSKEVIQLLMKNREDMLSVRGNHDVVVIDQCVNIIEKCPHELKKKNEWMKNLTQEEVDYLISLPYSIKIPHLKSIIVHAGILPGVRVEDMSDRDIVSMRNVVTKMDPVSGEVIQTPSTGTKEGTAWAKLHRGADHIYFGHDARRKLQQELFATGLDTGCVYGGDLTGVFIHGKRKGTLVKVHSIKPHVPVDN
jgi:hypothetical protein